MEDNNTVKIRVELDTNLMEQGRQEGVSRARVAAQAMDSEFIKSARERLREHQSLEKQRTREYLNEARERMRQEQADERTVRNYHRQRLSEEKQHAREVERINRETARQAAEQARTRERAAKQLADAETRAARQSADEMLRSLRRMKSEGERTAKDTGGGFSTYLGAGFFGALGASAVRAFYSRAKDFVSEGIKIASETANALKGVTLEAKFRGVNPSDVQDSIKNLRLVRAGILSIGDGATTVKNLLSSGFGLKQAVEITERFSDASAFGKQAALEHGTAIARASEGIKNQNSMLVDNVGLTKNLSVILKERGFALEDLSNKTRGAAAREALYQGIMAETASQVGNADKLVQGYSGTIAAHEQAYRNLQARVGEFVMQNPAHVEAIRIVTEQMSGYTSELGRADTATADFARQTLYAWDLLKSQAAPFAAFMGNSFMAIGSTVASALSGMLAVLTKFVETAVNGVVNAAKSGINLLVDSINTVTNLAKKIPMVMPNSPLGYLQSMPEMKRLEASNTAFLGSDNFARRTARYAESFIEYRGAAQRAANEGGQYRERLAQASRRPPRTGEVTLPSPVADALSTVRERGLPVSALGQSRTHQRLGLDHRGAFDVAVSPNSEAGRRIIRYLEENGIDYRAITARDIARGVKGTGEHIHVGAASRSIYRKVQQEVAADKAQRFALSARITQPPQLTTTGGIREDGLTKRLTTDEAALLESNKRFGEQAEELYNRQKNFAHELTRVWSEAALDRQHREMDTLRDIERAEAALHHLRENAADKGATEQRRLLGAKQEELDLTAKLIQLQDDYANAGMNDALRQQVALHEELVALRQRDTEAVESQIRSQVRLADQQVFHSEQARAKILEHMASAKGYTDIFADAFISASDALGDGMSSLFGKVNSGMGKFGEILTDIQTNLMKMVTNRLLMKLVDMFMGGGSSSGGVSFGGGGQGGGGGFSLGNVLGGVLGGGRSSGTAPFNPNASTFFNQFAPNGISSVFGNQFGGSSLTSFDTFSGRAGANSWLTQGAGSPVFSAFNGGQSQGGVLSRLGLGKLKGGFAAMMPMLGASLGSALGGRSALGRGFGAIGGGILGLGGLMGGGIAGLLNPVTAIPAAILMGAAFIIGRNQQRRADETARNQLTLDANGQLDQLIRQVRNHQTDPASALAQASEIRSNYLAEAGKLKDKKARNHALLTVRELDYRITQLRSAATTALNDNTRRNITSAFATGGVVSGQRGEPRLILAHGGEIVASLANQTPELMAAAADAGIPAVRSSPDGGSRVKSAPVVNVQFFVGKKDQSELFVNGIKSDAGYNGLTRAVRDAAKHRDI